jgi:DNA-directed RNA polymerase subunit M/transcription elongation factor TFIIS
MSSKKEKNNAFNILMMASSSSSKKKRITNTSTITSTAGKGIGTKPSPSSSKKENKKTSTPNTRIRKEEKPLSKFVICPICNINVVESNINIHLDQCMMKDENDNNIKEPMLGNSDNKSSIGSKRQYHHDIIINEENKKKAKKTQYESELVASSSPKKNDESKPNVFSQMMNCSKQLHKQYKPRTYSFMVQ